MACCLWACGASECTLEFSYELVPTTYGQRPVADVAWLGLLQQYNVASYVYE